MKKNLSFIVALLLMTLVISSCKKESTNPADYINTVVLPASGTLVIDANNQFAFDFFQATIAQDTATNNKLISPLSIYLALSMVYNGANNATRDSISQTLQLSGLDINSLNEICQALITQFPKEDNKVQLSIANSIWYRQNSYQPLLPFLNTVQDNYDASIQGLNFGDPNAVNTINN